MQTLEQFQRSLAHMDLSNIPPPDAPEFAEVRADLSRLFLQRRAELGLALESDEWIVEHTSDVAAVLIPLGKRARQDEDWPWFPRHKWWFEACARLFNDQPAVPLDG